MGDNVMLAEITANPIDLAVLTAAVDHRSAGAVVSFAGVVRDHDGGRLVTSLRYEAHPTAADALMAAALKLAPDSPPGSIIASAARIAVAHRIGELRIGDVALACAVSAPHRAEAFERCSLLVNAVKATVPIWKLQRFADDTQEWVGAS